MSVISQSESNITTSANKPQDRSLGELFGDLTRETTQLIRQELDLAKTEMTQKATRVAKDAGMIAVGGFIAYVGVLALVGALIFGLVSLGMKMWVASLIVGLLFSLGGAFLAWQGYSALKHVDPVPHQTVETLKEDQQWIKEQK